jgi:hypothetical protein
MFGRTLSLYFARHFFKMVSAIFLLAFLLIALVTYFEFFNRALKGDATPGLALAAMALFRVPSISEESIPFAVLYGSIAAFVIANRRLEVVVARAAGVSAWQFLLPACIVGLLFGIVGTTIYNPAAARLPEARCTGGREHRPGVGAAVRRRRRFDHRIDLLVRRGAGARKRHRLRLRQGRQVPRAHRRTARALLPG